MPLVRIEARMAILNHLEIMGCDLINSMKATINCMNKFIHLQILARAKLPIPKTICNPYIDFETSISSLDFNNKFVIKALRDHKGKQVFLSSKNMAQDIHGCLDHSLPYLFQEYIEDSYGKSLRIIVIDGKISAVMQFKNINHFKSNIAQGAERTDVFGLYPKAEELALKVTSCLELDIAGVDLLFQKDGSFVVCEVNANPGLKIDYQNLIVINIINMIKDKMNK